MTDIFISYARSTEAQAHQVAEALRGLGYAVWRDDEIPAHRAFNDVIEEHLKAAKAVVVIWSQQAVRSEWVRSEADRARAEHKLVQLTVDGAPPPMPFDQIQCVDLSGWRGDTETPGWRRVAASVAELMGAPAYVAPPRPAQSSPVTPGKASIAVLSFSNLSGDSEQDYFTDGMVVEITNALSRFKSLFVVASGSSLSLKDRELSPVEAARRLGVRYVLEGSVRKASDRIRVAAQLIDAESGSQIWAQRFDDTLADIFELQDKVALGVAAVIEPTVQAAELRRAAARPTESLGAYDLYLRALALSRTVRKRETEQALELFDRAVELDPNYGAALARAARARSLMVYYRWSDEVERLEREADELAERALRVAGDDALVVADCAVVLGRQNKERRFELLRRAIALNPGAAAVWVMSGAYHMHHGEPEIAIEHLQRSLQLDPLSESSRDARLFIAIARFEQRRFEEAVALFREVDHTHPSSQATLASAYGHLGRTTEARDALARYRELSPVPPDVAVTNFFAKAEHQKLFLDGIALAADPK